VRRAVSPLRADHDDPVVGYKRPPRPPRRLTASRDLHSRRHAVHHVAARLSKHGATPARNSHDRPISSACCGIWISLLITRRSYKRPICLRYFECRRVKKERWRPKNRDHAHKKKDNLVCTHEVLRSPLPSGPCNMAATQPSSQRLDMFVLPDFCIQRSIAINVCACVTSTAVHIRLVPPQDTIWAIPLVVVQPGA
jgi:hypothetical protein